MSLPDVVVVVDEYNNEFTWRCSCCARDLIIGHYTSIEKVIVSDVMMYSSEVNLSNSFSQQPKYIYIRMDECERYLPV
jgi:hypothetical protein